MQEQGAPAPQKSEPATKPDENSPGRQLAKARVGLGLTQQQVADRLHLRVNSVQAVEEDALEKGVSVTFNKGYVRLYAKLVRLDAQPLLDAYDKLHASDNQPAKLQSFSRRVTREAHDLRWNMVTIVVVLLVLGSVIGWWVQQSDSLENSQSFVSETFDKLFSESDKGITNTNQTNLVGEVDIQDTQVAEDSSVVLQNTGPAIPDNEVSEADAYVDEEDATNEMLDTMPEPTAEPSEIAASDNDFRATRSANLIEGTNRQTDTQQDQLSDEFFAPLETHNGFMVNTDGTVNMAFTFKDDCWVSVKDANDEVIAIGVKAKGRVMEVSGIPPIRVILGAPQNVEINFGGKDIDMTVYPGGRSANFQLSVESE